MTSLRELQRGLSVEVPKKKAPEPPKWTRYALASVLIPPVIIVILLIAIGSVPILRQGFEYDRTRLKADNETLECHERETQQNHVMCPMLVDACADTITSVSAILSASIAFLALFALSALERVVYSAMTFSSGYQQKLIQETTTLGWFIVVLFLLSFFVGRNQVVWEDIISTVEVFHELVAITLLLYLSTFALVSTLLKVALRIPFAYGEHYMVTCSFEAKLVGFLLTTFILSDIPFEGFTGFYLMVTLLHAGCLGIMLHIARKWFRNEPHIPKQHSKRWMAWFCGFMGVCSVSILVLVIVRQECLATDRTVWALTFSSLAMFCALVGFRKVQKWKRDQPPRFGTVPTVTPKFRRMDPESDAELDYEVDNRELRDVEFNPEEQLPVHHAALGDL